MRDIPWNNLLTPPVEMPVLVTTSHRADRALRRHAELRAGVWQVPFVPRDALPSLWAITSSGASLLIFSGHGLQLVDRYGTLVFHEGLAHLRKLHLGAGGREPLVHIGALCPGDQVLDCTMGLAQDALVAARAVGGRGRVVAVESSLVLFAVVSEGLCALGTSPESCPIEPVHADHVDLLRHLPRGSFDVIYFDPMFSAPCKAQVAFDAVRRQGNPTPLNRWVIEQARRVARRWVVVKCAKGSSVPMDLGMERVAGARTSPFDWARIPGQDR